MTVDEITYVAEPDNCREVIAWLKARSLFAECQKCHGTGEYEGEYGPTGCMPCVSRVIAVKTSAGVRYADWGDTIAYDGHVAVLVKAAEDAE